MIPRAMRNRIETALVGLLLLIPIFALGQVTQTGVITGTVTDAGGEPLVAALVRATSPGLLGRSVATLTDGDGRYRIPGLPPGIYRLEVELEGYSKRAAENIQLRVGDIVTLDISLAPLDAAPLPDIEKKAALLDLYDRRLGLSMERSPLESLPTRRSFQEAADLAAGFNPIDGFFAARGADARSTTYYLDGVDITDPASGRLLVDFPYDCIAGIEVTTAAIDAFQGQGAGGTVNVVTGTDGRGLHGRASLYFRNGVLDSGNDPLAGKPKNNAFLPSFNLGGPLRWRDSWFHAGFAYRWEEGRQPAARPAPESLRGNLFTCKASLPITAGIRLGFRYLRDSLDSLRHYAPNTVLWNIPEGDPDQSTSDERRTAGFFSAGLLTRLSDTVSVNFSASWSGLRRETAPTAENADSATIDYFRRMWSGAYPGFSELDTGDRWLFQGGMNYYLDEPAGAHDITLGLEAERSTVVSELSLVGGRRTVEYDGELLYRQEMYSLGSRAQAFVNTGATITRFSIFAQNNWSPFHRLVLNLGVRFDGPTMENSNYKLAEWESLSPRIGFNFDPIGDGRLALRAGIARYYGKALLDRVSPDPMAVTTVFSNKSQAGLEKLLGGLPEGWSLPYVVVEKYGYGPNCEGADLRTKAPVTEELLMSVDTELVQDFRLSVSLIRRKTRKILGYVETEVWQRFSSKKSKDAQESGVDGGADLPAYVWTNDHRVSRSYLGWEVSALYRLPRGLMLEAYYLWSKTEGNVDLTPLDSYVFSPLYLHPSSPPEGYWYLSTDRRHTLQALLYGRIASGWDFAAVLRYSSGAPYYRLLFNDNPLYAYYTLPADSGGSDYRLDAVMTADIRLERSFSVGSRSAALALEVYNLFNSSAVSERNEFDGPDFGEPIARIPPRTLQIGISYSF
jgi:hypothetical protein